MDNLRTVIDLLFTDADVNALLRSINDLSGSSGSNSFMEKDKFKNLFFSRYPHYYSGDHLNTLLKIITGEWSHNKIVGYDNCKSNVFNILSNITAQLLETDGGLPYCKYKEYLRWNEVCKSVGEDMLVTSYLAASDFNNHFKRTDFAWPPFLLTINKDLNGVMSKGLAELHNHLYGSSHIFSLNWLELMNFPSSVSYSKIKRIKNMEGCYQKVLLAAFIRSVLYKCVNDKKDASIETIVKLWLRSADKLQSIELLRGDVQKFISRLRTFKTGTTDYAIPARQPVNIKGVDGRTILTGERKLLYQCFSAIIKGGESQLFQTLFYIYLVIKSQFRKAMLQVDNIMGFENFLYYDRKKSLFLDSPIYNKALADIAVKSAVQDTFVKHIEYRITPKNTAAELLQSIQVLHNPLDNIKNSVEYGFIIHFIKRDENSHNNHNSVFNGLVCRNYAIRNKINRESYSVRQLIERGYPYIIGIDAASSEFVCRPEVFGTVFRRLRNASHNQDRGYLIPIRSSHLGITYHVGEDFYDIIDGLRAIDEAIKFLNLENGDRIGHGTALGINVNHYYEEKHFTVVMPKQVLLDNLVWLIRKIEIYGIDGGKFLQMLKDDFYKLRREIFQTGADEWTFMNAWLLRGDDPRLYKNVNREPKLHKLMDMYELNMDKSVVEARSDKAARTLYYRYHYDYIVKKEGDEPIEWKIEREYRALFISILKKLQEKMQSEVAEKHIAIECNPTSNLRIGNIPRYIDHPIIKFNDEGLVRTDGKQDPSSHISVSINTDDAGIFATSLEKEYTLMALALEKEKDNNGESVYERSSVYRWLENIRQAAFVRKFGSDK